MNNLIKNIIQKQLLNFNQDLEFDKSNSAQKNINKSIEKEKWLVEHTVDLGLPSGTLWMKNNLGATCGDSPESWHGDYYAWGELEPKKNYSEKNYIYKNNHVILPFDYDIAFQKTNGICNMPTEEQFEELIKETKHIWINNYNGVNGLNGKLFTGLNGNILFIPAAGYYSDRIYNYGAHCYLWSSQIYQSITYYSYNLYFYPGNIQVSHNFRYFGLSVRGVYK